MTRAFRLAPQIFPVLLAFCFFANRTSAQSSLKLSSEQQSRIHDLVSRVLKHADGTGCKKSCAILVANFTGETGSTSSVGMQLADEVSAQLAAQANGIQIAGRRNLQQYLEKERIASKLLEDDNAARWLAMENGATAVLIGYLKVGLTQASLHVQLLDTKDFGKREIRGKTYVEEETFQDIANFGSLEPAEPFGEMPPPTIDGEAIPQFGAVSGASSSGIKPPVCYYKPDPSYTDAARRVKFNGTLILQTIISKDGVMLDVRPIKGAPFGLNRSAVDTVRTWKCHPPTNDGTPVTSAVPVEVSFRLF